MAALQLARERALALMQALLPVLSLALALLPSATSAPALLIVLLLMLALALARALAGPIYVCALLHLCVSVFMLLCVYMLTAQLHACTSSLAGGNLGRSPKP